jgi:hypothetical protein
MNKRGVSKIVTAVLFILMAVALIILVWSFLPTIINSEFLSDADCFEGEVLMTERSCYNTTSKELILNIKNTGAIQIDRFISIISYESDTFESHTHIFGNNRCIDTRMCIGETCDGEYGELLPTPSQNSILSYALNYDDPRIFSETPEEVKLRYVLKVDQQEKTCEGNKLIVKECIN